VEWIFFALAVAVIAVIGVGVGLLVARRVAGRAERRSGGDDSAFMTPVGPPPDAERLVPDQDGADEGPKDG